ncbi:MAG: hypothetical protein QXL77_00030 [Candidatus Bathyarchaeia archaeon]|nr:hypothetical protein [Candidatus Bathyarchaeota archaeon]
MKKGLAYALIAVVLGVLAVVVPLFLVPVAPPDFESKFAPQAIPKRMESLEELYGIRGAPMQGVFAGLLMLAVGFAAALAAYSITKARFFH